MLLELVTYNKCAKLTKWKNMKKPFLDNCALSFQAQTKVGHKRKSYLLFIGNLIIVIPTS